MSNSIVEEVLALRGVQLNPVQREALPLIISDKNLVLCWSTGAGKTLAGEIAIYKALSDGKKAVYLVPLKALGNEKYEYFRKYEQLGYLVTLRSGDFDSDDSDLVDYDIIIATYEKMDSIIRHKASWLNDIGCIVVDEAHNITERGRGIVLEILLTRLKLLCKNARIVCLSAVMSNAEDVARWLNADLHISSWKSVPHVSGVAYQLDDDVVIEWKDNRVERLPVRDSLDIVATLVLDTVVNDNAQAMVFCHSRKSTIDTAQYLSRYITSTLSKDVRDKLNLIATQIHDPELAQLIRNGVAYHNAGLSREERILIEEGFKRQYIKVITATTSLAQGVNLPARRLIVKTIKRYDPNEGWVLLPKYEFNNLAGRAGRYGLDPIGEVIVLAKEDGRYDERPSFIMQYLDRENEPIVSQLTDLDRIHSHVLATIALEPLTEDELKQFFLNTFGAVTIDKVTLADNIENSVALLEKLKLIYKKDGKLHATLMGSRVSLLYISPLTYAQTLIYLNSEYSTNVWLDAVVGFDDFELDRYNVNFAQVLRDWIDEHPKQLIAQRYNVGQGDIHVAVDLAEWLIHAASVIASILGHRDTAKQLQNLEVRIKYGVRDELVELCKIKWIGREIARRLYDNKIKTKDELKRNIDTELVRKITGKFYSRIREELI